MSAIPPASGPGPDRAEDQSYEPRNERPPAAQQRPGPTGTDSLVDDLRALRRARDGRVVAGVCTGVGRQLGVDPVVLRVVMAVLTLFGGVGLLLYAAGWLLLPDEGDELSILEQQLGRRRNGASDGAVVVAGLVVLGLVVLSVPWWGFPWHVPTLLVLSILGLVALVRRNADHGGDTSGTATRSAGPGGPSDGTDAGDGNPPTQVLGDTTWLADLRQPDPGTGTVASTTGPPGSWRDAAPAPASFWNQPDPLGLETGEEPAPSAPATWTPPPAPAQRDTGRSWLFAVTVAAILVVEVILAGISDDTPLPAAAFVAAALGVVGVGLIVGTWVGRARALTALGVVLALVLVPTSAADQWPGGTVDARLKPASANMVNPIYRYGAGSLELDLTQVPFDGHARAVSTTIDLGMGEVRVLVPSTVDVEFTGHVGLGQLSAFQEHPYFDGRPGFQPPGKSFELERESERGVRSPILGPTPPAAPEPPAAPTGLEPFDDRPGGVESGGNNLTERLVDNGSDGPGGGRLILNVELGVGHLEVQRVS